MIGFKGTLLALILVFNLGYCLQSQEIYEDDKVAKSSNSDQFTKSESKKENKMEEFFKIEETIEKTIPVGSSSMINISNFEGKVVINSGSTNEVKVKAKKMAMDEKSAKGIKVNISQESDKILLEADFVNPDRKVNLDGNTFYSKGAYVEWDIIMPPNLNLSVETGDGMITIKGINGKMAVKTKDGNLKISECAGDLNAETYDGKVEIVNFSGDANVTNRGDQSMTFEGNFKNLTAETGGGDIFLGLPKSKGGTLISDTIEVSSQGISLSKNTNIEQNFFVGSGNSTFKFTVGPGKILIYVLK